jgi:hypothetical protein
MSPQVTSISQAIELLSIILLLLTSLMALECLYAIEATGFFMAFSSSPFFLS